MIVHCSHKHIFTTAFQRLMTHGTRAIQCSCYNIQSKIQNKIKLEVVVVASALDDM